MGYFVRATWVPATDADVATQRFTWVVDGEEKATINLGKSISSRTTKDDGIAVKEGDTIGWRVVAQDTSGNNSEPFTQEIFIPVIPPGAPSGGVTEYEFEPDEAPGEPPHSGQG